MSDGSYEEEWGSDDGGQGGGWDNSDGQNEDPDTDTEIENAFYEAEGDMKDSPEDSLERFESGVVMMEENRDEKRFSFKAIMNIIIITA